MPRHKSLVTVIRELVQTEVSNALQGIIGGIAGGKRKAKNGRRRRKRRRGVAHPRGWKGKVA